VVVDLGGASMELCRIEHGHPGQGISTPLGPLRLRTLGTTESEVDAGIAARTRMLADGFGVDGGRLYLVGGAWRALARAHMERTGYPMRVLHEYGLTADQVLEHADWASGSDPDKISALPGVSSSRAPVLPLAARLLRYLVEALQPGDVMVSGFGLREGVCLENMPDALRGLDPLMAACDKQEVLRARAPGFGAELADWVVRILPPADAAEERLVRAAARLVDVNWRSHPDYRVTGCWETVTRTSITDAGHLGRAFMGMLLAARYKRARRALEQSGLPRLLGEAERGRAMCYGSAFRLGAVLSGSTPGVLGDCAVSRAPGRLDLVLDGAAAEFAGEEVDKRFGQLLRELNAEGAIRTGAAA
jgi:exopolyphosphatase/guanosine-5'-triphosphate,3'-diphosphate pyrophosphatase